MTYLRKLARLFRRAVATVAFGQGTPQSVTLKSRVATTFPTPTNRSNSPRSRVRTFRHGRGQDPGSLWDKTGQSRCYMANTGVSVLVAGLAFLQLGCDATSPSHDSQPIVVEARPAVTERGTLQVRLTSSRNAVAGVPVVLRVYDLAGNVVDERKFASLQDVAAGAVFTDDSTETEGER